jgi:hypothetical protein
MNMCEENSASRKKKNRITKQRTIEVQETLRKGVHKERNQTGEWYEERDGYLGRTIVCHKESYIH